MRINPALMLLMLLSVEYENSTFFTGIRCAIAELDGRWNSSLSDDDVDATQIALHLHQIGADRAFAQLTSSPSCMFSIHLLWLLA